MSDIARPSSPVSGFLSRPNAPVLVLLSVTVIWGWTFLLTRLSLPFIGPYAFVGWRFGVAALAVVLVTRPHPASFTRMEITGGITIGLVLFLGYGLQANGLRTVASGESAFLTALYVPMVPLLEFLIFRRRPGLFATAGLVLAFAGLVLVSGMTGLSLAFDRGQWLTLGGALGAALEIVLIGHSALTADPRRIAIVQLATVSVISFAVEAVRGGIMITTRAFPFAAMTGMGLATAFVLVAQNWAQRSIPANRATLIYTLEPVWAGLVGAAFGEIFAPAQVLGGVLIIASVVLSQWKS